MEKSELKFPCPCCGYLIFNEEPGSCDICEICFWEDDLSQLRFVNMSGANHLSLIEAKKNFNERGACEDRLLAYVRKPLKTEKKDASWRPIDLKIDNIEEPISGKEYGMTYPDDPTVFYYWKPTYWRLKIS